MHSISFTNNNLFTIIVIKKNSLLIGIKAIFLRFLLGYATHLPFISSGDTVTANKQKWVFLLPHFLVGSRRQKVHDGLGTMCSYLTSTFCLIFITEFIKEVKYVYIAQQNKFVITFSHSVHLFQKTLKCFHVNINHLSNLGYNF